jgi:putative transposase
MKTLLDVSAGQRCYHTSNIIMRDLPTRKSVRLEAFHYRGQKRYFVTICSYHRKQIFADTDRAIRILELLRAESARNYFEVHAYCLMPDHRHLFAEGTDPASDLRRFVRNFKMSTSRRYANDRGNRLWQRDFYEHVMRPTDSFESIAWYIWMNPIRKSLAVGPQEYPFSGSFTGMKMPSAWNASGWCPPWKKIPCPEN